jgi:hypothetical protein
LQRHGLDREDKNVHRAHMTVSDYKAFAREPNLRLALQSALSVTGDILNEEVARSMKQEIHALRSENRKRQEEKTSPYKAFFYTSPEKQAYVQTRLDEMRIPYRETDNGFEAKDCYVETIRKLEKEFSPKTNNREQIRNDIDRMLMMSKDLDELYDRMRDAGYTIKDGKYTSVRPKYGKSFFRLKGLGEQYSEQALENRLLSKAHYEQMLDRKVAEAKQQQSHNYIVLRTMRFYTTSFATGGLPMHRREQEKPFAWTNDAELDVMLALNRKLNEGATFDSLRQDFADNEQAAAAAEQTLQKEEAELKSFYDLKEKLLILFEGKKSDLFTREQAAQVLKTYPSIHKGNYLNVNKLIASQEETVRKAAAQSEQAQQALAESAATFSVAEMVFGGTYVQHIAAEERQRRETRFIKNGLKLANGRGI